MINSKKTNLDITDDDIKVIKWQLNTNEVYLGTIVERCKHGYPSVILLNAGIENLNGTEKKQVLLKTVSNFLWLTCPYLNKKIHDLESKGFIKKIFHFLQSKKNMQRLMKNAHAHYYYLRKGLFIDLLDNTDSYVLKNSVFATGIGGIKEIENLKCLHLHFAHFRLCDENVVGRVIYNLLDKEIYCEEVTCKNAE